jgi:hypothetical protein
VHEKGKVPGKAGPVGTHRGGGATTRRRCDDGAAGSTRDDGVLVEGRLQRSSGSSAAARG